MAFAAAAVLVVVALAVGSSWLAWVGLGLAVAFAGLLAAYLIVAERRRHGFVSITTLDVMEEIACNC